MSVLEFRCRLHYRSGFALDAEWESDSSVTALYGPSGSGKTTILSLIAGLRVPESGRIALGERVLYDGVAAVSLPPESRRVGYVFQQHLLFPHLSVRENLLYGWSRRALSARSIEPDSVVDVLELGDLLERRPPTLSGGQAQRVALGRALLCTPELLLLDEPLASIDDELRAQVLGYIEQVLAKWRIPTVYVSHDASEVRRLAGTVVHVRHGRTTAVERA